MNQTDAQAGRLNEPISPDRTKKGDQAPIDGDAKENDRPAFDWKDGARKAIASPLAIPFLIVAAGLGFLFWPMLRILPTIWFSKDGYYSHAPLVPLISGYIIYRRWPKMKDLPVKPSYWALIAMAPLLLLLKPAYTAEVTLALSLGLVALILVSVWLLAGIRWMLSLSPAVIYLLFGLPVWTMAIDNYTNPLQQLSTKVAFALLSSMGFHPWQSDNTTIYLNHFTLDVGVACSGLKLVLAVTAFTIFFMLVANLKSWANTVMALLVLPLCLFINGLRIALIGVVGDQYGPDAGHQFHDYSGYITLILCFIILFKIARALGWKD